MVTVEKSIKVRVPLHAAYAQWTHFEDFPIFMESITDVWQLDATHLHWRAEIAGREQEWDAEIIEQIPDRRIAWRSSGDAPHGTVSFRKLNEAITRVLLQLEYDPQRCIEAGEDARFVFSRRIAGDLERYKEFLEAQKYQAQVRRASATPEPRQRPHVRR